MRTTSSTPRTPRLRTIAPDWLESLGLSLVVRFLGAVDRNYFTFEVGDERFRVFFSTPEGFRTFYGMIDGEIFATEHIPLEYLAAPDAADAIIDIGAHFGAYSVLLGLLNPGVPVYSFEPDAYNRQVLRENLRLNGIDATVVDKVVSDKSGSITFYRRPGQGSQGHSTQASTTEGVTEVEMDCVSLSDFCAQHGIERPYLKIDAEGEEYNIAKDLVSAPLEAFWALVEIHPSKLDVSPDEIRRVFEEAGYRYEFVAETEPDHHAPRPAYFVTGA